MEKRRKEKGLSYKELAKKIGVSSPYISKVFKGDANLTIRTMFKLARAVKGKISLKVIDENVSTSPELWLAKIKPKTQASNENKYLAESKVTSNLDTNYINAFYKDVA